MAGPTIGRSASRARSRSILASMRCTSCCSRIRALRVPDCLRRRPLLASAICAMAAALIPLTSSGQQASKARRILLLHPTELLLQGAVEQDALTRKALTDALPGPLEFYSFGFDEV